MGLGHRVFVANARDVCHIRLYKHNHFALENYRRKSVLFWIGLIIVFIYLSEQIYYYFEMF